jgi:hypothetical protein
VRRRLRPGGRAALPGGVVRVLDRQLGQPRRPALAPRPAELVQLAGQDEERRRVEDGVVHGEVEQPLVVAEPGQPGAPERGPVHGDHGAGETGGPGLGPAAQVGHVGVDGHLGPHGLHQLAGLQSERGPQGLVPGDDGGQRPTTSAAVAARTRTLPGRVNTGEPGSSRWASQIRSWPADAGNVHSRTPGTGVPDGCVMTVSSPSIPVPRGTVRHPFVILRRRVEGRKPSDGTCASTFRIVDGTVRVVYAPAGSDLGGVTVIVDLVRARCRTC